MIKNISLYISFILIKNIGLQLPRSITLNPNPATRKKNHKPP